MGQVFTLARQRSSQGQPLSVCTADGVWEMSQPEGGGGGGLSGCLVVGCSHIASASGQAWKEGKIDFTGAQMVLTLKLISLAVCYQDGLKKEEVRCRLSPPLYAPPNNAVHSVCRTGASASQLQPAASVAGTGSTTASPRQALGMCQGGIAHSATVRLTQGCGRQLGWVVAVMRQGEGGELWQVFPLAGWSLQGGRWARRSCRRTSRRTDWWSCRRPWRRCPTSSVPATCWPVGAARCPLVSRCTATPCSSRYLIAAAAAVAGLPLQMPPCALKQIQHDEDQYQRNLLLFCSPITHVH